MSTHSISILDEPVVVINLGLKQFALSLEGQEVEVVDINWSPPAGGDEEMLDILDQLI